VTDKADQASDTLTASCPDCGAELVIDRKTGKVLLHTSKPKQPQDFEALLKGIDDKKARDQAAFEREKAAMDDKDRLLEEQFKKALERADEVPDKDIVRPFDLD
jgi:hypothetical protein